MSSILEALKKVERESALSDGQEAPWPLPALPLRTRGDRPRRWFLWIPLGSIAVLFFIVSVFWLARLSTPDSQPAASKPLIEPIAAAKPQTRSVVPPDPATPPPVRRKVPEVPPSAPPATLPQNKTVPSEAHDVSSIQSPPQGEAPPTVSSEARPAFINPPQSEVKPGETPEGMRAFQNEPSPGVAPEARPAFIPPPQGEPEPTVTPEDMTASIKPPHSESGPDMTPEARPPSAAPAKATSTQRPVGTASAPEPSEDFEQEDPQKDYRTDHRIDLQALVWAPETADRFVVINNVLLKEGGSIENITVLRINPDDVLFSEGSDRWHQEFKIR